MLYDTGSPNPVLCDNVEGWDRVGGGREVHEGGDICIPMADSWCMAETNTILQRNYPLIKTLKHGKKISYRKKESIPEQRGEKREVYLSGGLKGKVFMSGI